MESRVVVQAVEGTPFECGVEVRGHRLRADEPIEAGGTDRGPTPFEMLLAALGACTSMTLRMYAWRKGWDLRDVEVSLDRVPLKEPGGPETEVRRAIRMTGDLDAEKRARLLEIAGKCPVHRALHGAVRVTTTEG
jgi:uncharacterized OsmC-like protein